MSSKIFFKIITCLVPGLGEKLDGAFFILTLFFLYSLQAEFNDGIKWRELQVAIILILMRKQYMYSYLLSEIAESIEISLKKVKMCSCNWILTFLRSGSCS